jgi:acetate kinase
VASESPSGSVLVLNAGSSSLKFSAFDRAGSEPARRTLHGVVERIGPHARLSADGGDAREVAARHHGEAFAVAADWLRDRIGDVTPVAVGHRVVHGGARYDTPVRVDDAVASDLELLTPLAPLHQPQALSVLDAARERWPRVPHVACFDTAFHRAQPELAQLFALPRELREGGVRRYGFHGLSYEFIAGALAGAAPELAAGRVIVAHLGNGASLCAIRAGQSVDTTMSFSALDGLPMGTRVGNLDPAVVLYLITARGMSTAEVESLLYHRSGLFGLSGLSSDVRELLAARDHPGARLALDHYAYRIARETGALASSLGGLDAFVFTAGVGEHAAPVRAAVCERLGWLGVSLDARANDLHAPRISTADSRVAVHVIATDEEIVIARHTLAALA